MNCIKQIKSLLSGISNELGNLYVSDFPALKKNILKQIQRINFNIRPAWFLLCINNGFEIFYKTSMIKDF